VYLAADAARLDDQDLVGAFRVRALTAGVCAGALAVAGLGALAADAEPLFDDLVAGAGLPALLISGAAGITTLALVRNWRFEAARYSAGLAVAAIIAGWALAQQPTFLPGLTIEEAAASDATLVATLVGLVAGLVIVLPSLFLLFRLVLRGRFDAATQQETDAGPLTAGWSGGIPRGVRGVTAVFLLAGVALVLFGGDLAAVVGALALLAVCALATVGLLQPADLGSRAHATASDRESSSR
jgi:cytochrome d ubiquinol oxidase subunit II